MRRPWALRAFALRARVSALPAFGLATLLLQVGGCDGGASGGQYGIDEVRRLTEPRPVPPTAWGDAVRFGLSVPAGAGGQGGGHDEGEASIAWQLPAGWRELAPTAMRLGNFAVEGKPEIDCSLSVLPGRAGGVADNVNRWRGQLGLGPLAAEAVSALPRRGILGTQGVLIEAEGTYTAMMPSGGPGQPREGYKLLGVIGSRDGSVVFLKMTGPKADVDAERARFEALCASLAVETHDPHDGHDHSGHSHPPMEGASGGSASSGAADPLAHAPPAGAAAGPAPAPEAGILWTAPEGWSLTAPRPMRMATFAAKESPEVDVYISKARGGVAANLNRWLGQIGKAPMPEAAIPTLPQVDVLGVKATLIEATGTFTGMDGSAQAGQALLGIICPLGQDMVFVKMTGPEAAVGKERERFLTLVASLRFEETK